MSRYAFAAICICTALAACDRAPLPILLSDSCAVDVPARGGLVERGAKLHVGGWAFDRIAGNAPDNVHVQLVSEDQRTVKSFSAPRGRKRLDVVKAYGAPGAESSGFDVILETSALEPGRYAIYVLQGTHEKLLLCANDFHFFIK